MRLNPTFRLHSAAAAMLLLAVSFGGCLDPAFEVWARNSTASEATVTVAITDSDGDERFNETKQASPGATTYLSDGELKWKSGDYTVTAWVDGERVSESMHFSDSLSGVKIAIAQDGSSIVSVLS